MTTNLFMNCVPSWRKSRGISSSSLNWSDIVECVVDRTKLGVLIIVFRTLWWNLQDAQGRAIYYTCALKESDVNN